MKRLRFSLRTALAAMTIVAVILYWCSRPSILAQRFVDAVNNADYAAADAMFTDNEYRFAPGQSKISATRMPRTLVDWLSGRCRINVTTESTQEVRADWSELSSPRYDALGRAWMGTTMNFKWNSTIEATAFGLEMPRSVQFPDLPDS